MDKRLLIVSLIALTAHTAASARTIKLPSPATAQSQPGFTAPQARVDYSDLDLRHVTGAEKLRRRLDQTVIALSGGTAVSTRPDVMQARRRARVQADAIIGAARA